MSGTNPFLSLIQSDAGALETVDTKSKERPLNDILEDTSNSKAEGLLWSIMDRLNGNIHSLLMSLLKCGPTVKNKTLAWFGGCLKNNATRGGIWNSQTPPNSIPQTIQTSQMDL
ncbi:hypothetical protein NQ317_012676 [Molorchus minor]|uniref:Ubiquitin conjugation factor E4 core domain-containing protein n=1 Tax=Molorchus minor TaxID=1323400 RepID=A0ABQ9JCA4_9CUCU|nr:hypothetical protein NQ317_012676 [Molorchus minor]